MNLLELSKLIDDESITKVEFTDDGFIIDFSKTLLKKDSYSVRGNNDNYSDLTVSELRRFVRLSKTGVTNLNSFNYTQVYYNATLHCNHIIKLSCVINITRNLVSKNKLSFRYKLIINNDISSTEINLYIKKFDILISIISEIEFQGKMVTINNINQLISNHGFNFTMVCE